MVWEEEQLRQEASKEVAGFTLERGGDSGNRGNSQELWWAVTGQKDQR